MMNYQTTSRCDRTTYILHRKKFKVKSSGDIIFLKMEMTDCSGTTT